MQPALVYRQWLLLGFVTAATRRCWQEAAPTFSHVSSPLAGAFSPNSLLDEDAQSLLPEGVCLSCRLGRTSSVR